MPTTIDRLKVIFLVIFAVCCAITWTYHFMYIWPRNQCEDKGDWWDAQDRVCAVPMPISQFTGRALKASTPAAKAAPSVPTH
ncbi:MAG TPA: hypothetical protein VHY32_11215 [Caulobacteraceae bacterium]|jgi:hypothetical protein|nr:hypothetical protein [Caulobacteraceae bacterium]